MREGEGTRRRAEFDEGRRLVRASVWECDQIVEDEICNSQCVGVVVRTPIVHRCGGEDVELAVRVCSVGESETE